MNLALKSTTEKNNFRKLASFFLFLSNIYFSTAQVSQIRWGTKRDLLNDVTITWSNNGTNDSIAWGYTSNFEMGNFAGKKRSGYATPNFFTFTFSNFIPDTLVNYKIWNSATNSWDIKRSFQTAPKSEKNKFSFAALGDCRTSPSVLTTISNSVATRKPAVCLFNGDLTLSGTSASEYNTFFSASSNFLEKNIILHAEGNHDAGSPVLFSNLWDLPITNGSNLYYAVKHSNCLFITINSCDPTNSSMKSWLHSTLASASNDPTITWKIVSFHHPFFNVGAHQGDMNAYRSSIWKEFDDYGVDIVFNGHDHNYQRSKPINLNVSSSNPVANYGSKQGEGRLEIISGGAGASLYTKGSSADAWAMSIFNSTYNYVFCDVNDCSIKIAAYNLNNVQIDAVTLNKCNNTSNIESEKTTINPLSIYPNPAKNSFTLTYNSPIMGQINVRLIDEKGKLIFSEFSNKTQEKFEYKHDVSHLSKGIYTLSVNQGIQTDSGIIIIE